MTGISERSLYTYEPVSYTHLYRAESGAEPTADEIERINEAIRRADHYGYNLRTISHRYFIVEKFYPMDFRKSSKNPIQKSKFFNLADMFGYKTMPNTDEIANDLNLSLIHI